MFHIHAQRLYFHKYGNACQYWQALSIALTFVITNQEKKPQNGLIKQHKTYKAQITTIYHNSTISAIHYMSTNVMMLRKVKPKTGISQLSTTVEPNT